MKSRIYGILFVPFSKCTVHCSTLNKHKALWMTHRKHIAIANW